MNLLLDKWLPVVRQDGLEDTIAFYEITDDFKNPVVDIKAPRPDFTSAIYQLLIGVLQVMIEPKDNEEWEELWKAPPNVKEIYEKLLPYESCFIINNPEGPAFMQDYDWKAMQSAKEVQVSNLLINAPGENAYKENRDHFIKRGFMKTLQPYWAAIALYTLQSFSPSGGQGIRVGLRGGGPLTVIALPQEYDIRSSLWKKLWLNVLSRESFRTLINGDHTKSELSDIFPWMAETRTSKNDELTTPMDVNPKQMYFGMPRRVRLQFEVSTCPCDLTSTTSPYSVRNYRSVNKGVNYGGPWRHALSSYVKDSKNPENPPNPKKGSPEGISYRYWPDISISSEPYIIPANIKDLENEEKEKALVSESLEAVMWVCGYDMDNAKTRNWYDKTIPTFILPPAQQIRILDYSIQMISGAELMSRVLKKAIKNSWYKEKATVRGNLGVFGNEFWEATEDFFYGCLRELVIDFDAYPAIFEKWQKVLIHTAEEIFERVVLSAPLDGSNMKRVIGARKVLQNGIWKLKKSYKNLIV